MNLILAIVFILLYALVAVLVLELVFFIIGLFFTVPVRIRQIIYAIVGVVFLIYILQSILGAGPISWVPPRFR